MSGFFETQSHRQRISLLVILAFASVMLWQNPLGSMAMYPFTILSTWFHEMGHGLMAMAMGNQFEQLAIYPDGSGVAISLRPADSSAIADALTAAAGPLGPPIAGSGLILASRTRAATKRALLVLGGALALSTVIWVRSWTGWLVLPAFGIALLFIANRAPVGFQAFAIQFIGVQACISTYRQIDYLFSQGGVIDGRLQRSDTQAIADLLLLPYWFWGGAISALILAMLWWSFRRTFRR